MMDGETLEEERWYLKPPEERIIDSLGNVMMNLRDLPEFACDRSRLNYGTYWFPAYEACVTAYFTNARLAAEFFVKMPTQDYTAQTFLPSWSAPKGVATRLSRVWLMTSKHVVHMSKSRVPNSPEEWQQEDTTYGALMRITRDAYKALTTFVDAYAEDGEFGEHFRHMRSGVKPHSRAELATLRTQARRRAQLLTTEADG